MLSNRRFMNELKAENEKLVKKFINEILKNDFWRDGYRQMVARNKKLQADIENKENNVCNLLDSNKELSQENEFLRNKINVLETLVKWHEENECELNTKLVKVQGQLDKIDNYTRMLEGRGINE